MYQAKEEGEQWVFTCEVTKRKLFGSSKRILRISQNMIQISRDSNQPLELELSLSSVNRIIWSYTDKNQGHKLKGFTIDYDDTSREYEATTTDLQILKGHIANKVFQARVQDEYEALQVVGQGNYALVLELKHLHSSNRFASKCIDKKKLEGVENGMKSILNEIQIMRALSPHNHLVNLHELYEGDNNIYLIIDLAGGGSLYKEMKKRKNIFPRQEIKEIIKYLLIALEYIHGIGVMHRDLKPENILFKTAGDYSTLKVADFGLSTFQKDIPYLFPKCGTPGFVAPEVANLTNKQSGYDVACDIFSAGVIFHQLLFGESIFAGRGHHDILRLNKKCEIDLSHARYKMMDPQTRDLFIKMIEKDPTQRITASQALKHPYFSDEVALGKPESPLTPNSPFIQEELDEGTPVKLQKRDSILTRTPLYKGNSEGEQFRFSDFELDDQK